eukprot:CAMPEP_0184335530 /NCGR_PEP_ID=MMETSP1089-20130417/4087_1 /TAXON_ID=38269 ORGANISM="Gloeochaete wittrockiana, Strain SAG46.84" /NCGR_SAMPLE_ID=MMETSP1089 /ASSEMBLY_ACC=CAM_ASM_000445 /LENGTH=630 /DNA_ID=CAMNT_0026660239 /DNA_START=36 /DNA_END=1928 /DNA_ORIENTATION=+
MTDFSKLKVAELREQLRKKGLSTAGVKADLIVRLEQAVAKERSKKASDASDDESKRSDSESESAEEKKPAPTTARVSGDTAASIKDEKSADKQNGRESPESISENAKGRSRDVEEGRERKKSPERKEDAEEESEKKKSPERNDEPEEERESKRSPEQKEDEDIPEQETKSDGAAEEVKEERAAEDQETEETQEEQGQERDSAVPSSEPMEEEESRRESHGTNSESEDTGPRAPVSRLPAHKRPVPDTPHTMHRILARKLGNDSMETPVDRRKRKDPEGTEDRIAPTPMNTPVGFFGPRDITPSAPSSVDAKRVRRTESGGKSVGMENDDSGGASSALPQDQDAKTAFPRWTSQSQSQESKPPPARKPIVYQPTWQRGGARTDDPNHRDRAGPAPIGNSRFGRADRDDRSGPQSRKPPTAAIVIRNFVRPFTLPAVHELLAQYGKVVSFWMDKIKTHAYIVYESIEQSTAARQALHNLKWPPNSVSSKPLSAEFVSVEEARSVLEKPGADQHGAVGAAIKQAHIQAQQMQQAEKQLQQAFAQVARQLPDRTATHAPPPSRRSAATLPPAPIAPPPLPNPVNSLDELFRKTTTKLSLYWQPVSEEEVAKRRAALKPVIPTPAVASSIIRPER